MVGNILHLLLQSALFNSYSSSHTHSVQRIFKGRFFVMQHNVGLFFLQQSSYCHFFRSIRIVQIQWKQDPHCVPKYEMMPMHLEPFNTLFHVRFWALSGLLPVQNQTQHIHHSLPFDGHSGPVFQVVKLSDAMLLVLAKCV